MQEDKIAKIEKIDPAEKKSSAHTKFETNDIEQAEIERVNNDKETKERFNAILDKPIDSKDNFTSPIHTISKSHRTINTNTKITPAEFVHETQKMVAQLEEAKNTLNTAQSQGINLKKSDQALLQNKLIHIDENIKIALSQAGVDSVEPTQKKGLMEPIERFLGFLTDGQHKLTNLSTEIAKLDQDGTMVTPAKMLGLQIKVGYIQQEIEFFTATLNKSIESVKTLMNVQV